MDWTLKKSGLVIVTTAILLTTWTNCEARLWKVLFHKQESCETAAQGPVNNCTSGRIPTPGNRWNGYCRPSPSTPVNSVSPGSETTGQGNSSPGHILPDPEKHPVLVIPDQNRPGPGIESPIPAPTTNPSGPAGTTFPLPPIHPENRDPQDRTLDPGHTPIPPGKKSEEHKPVDLPDTFVPTQPPPVPVPKSNLLELPASDNSQTGFRSRPSIPGTPGFVPMQTLRVPVAYQQQQTLYRRPQLTDNRVQSRRFETTAGSTRNGWRVMRPYYD